MYELRQVGENTYYIDCPSKIGIYHLGEGKVCLIDSGTHKETGKKVLKILAAEGWEVACVIATHFHADHVGGCNVIQERTGCKVYAYGIDRVFLEYPILEPALLYGGYPPKGLRGKVFVAQECEAEALTADNLPKGLSIVELSGHSPSMIGIGTDDGVWFLADCMVSEATLTKYHVSYLYNLEQYLESLDRAEGLRGQMFVPAHGAAAADISALVQANRAKCMELLDLVRGFCREGITHEALLKAVFDHYSLGLDLGQYVLSGSTLRSYLSYLMDRKEVETAVVDNRLLWRSVPRA